LQPRDLCPGRGLAPVPGGKPDLGSCHREDTGIERSLLHEGMPNRKAVIPQPGDD
jgi:hypothetical protein